MSNTLLKKLERLVVVDSYLLKHPKDYHYQIERYESLIELELIHLAELSIREISKPSYISTSARFSYEEKGVYVELYNSLKEFDYALRNAKFNVMDYNNRAVRLADLGLFELAISDYLIGIEIITNNFPNAKEELNCFKFGLSTILLRLGDFSNGLPLYESRKDVQPIHNQFSNFQLWNGIIAKGKVLLLQYEQGIGDEFQYIRYAILLKNLGMEVIVNTHDITNDFLEYNLNKYDIKVIRKVGECVAFDYYCPIMSIPFLMKDLLIDIPYKDKYLFHSTESVKSLLKKDKLNIGVCWSSTSRPNDFIRNIGISKISSLFSIPNTIFHCIQKEISEDDKNKAKQWDNLFLYDSEISNFFDTSSLINELDLVITIDTSIAHLSAAMGKRTWILLPYKADSRWLLNRKDCIWYDNVRLFRQKLDYNWDFVIREVKNRLDILALS